MTQIIWLHDNTKISLRVDDEDQARLAIGPEPGRILLVGDRYELHRLIIEIDRQLSRRARLL